MPIRFRCVYCNQLLGIARRKAGTVVNCPHCGERLIVPTPEADDESAEIKSQPQPQPQPRGELASPTANKPPQAKMPQRASDAAEVVSAPKPAPKPARFRPARSTSRPTVTPRPAPVPASSAEPAASAAASPPAPAPSPSPAVRLFEQSDIAKLLLADANAEEAKPAADQQVGPGKVGRRPGSNTAAPESPTAPATAETEYTITINSKLATIVSVAVVLSLAFSFLMGVLVGRFLLR
jgi:DNA-directed RNA polymerase subunit RPC12/RpoP